jgi:hypothetical protein
MDCAFFRAIRRLVEEICIISSVFNKMYRMYNVQNVQDFLPLRAGFCQSTTAAGGCQGGALPHVKSDRRGGGISRKNLAMEACTVSGGKAAGGYIGDALPYRKVFWYTLSMNWFIRQNVVLQALLATVFTYGMTALGAGTVFFFKSINRKVLDGLLGFAAGVMIAASFFSLLAPAIEMAAAAHDAGKGLPPWAAAAGFLLGGVFLRLADSLLPHLHAGEKDARVTFPAVAPWPPFP